MANYPNFSSHNYEVVRELGRNREGGRISYLAKELDSEQQVVIKQFRFLQTDSSWQGFKAYDREIQVLQELEHPRIPHYVNSFETVDGFCMVQEYKNAPTLAEKPTSEPEINKKYCRLYFRDFSIFTKPSNAYFPSRYQTRKYLN
jgi:serine/threonine protein kinase